MEFEWIQPFQRDEDSKSYVSDNEFFYGLLIEAWNSIFFSIDSLLHWSNNFDCNRFLLLLALGLLGLALGIAIRKFQ